VEGVIMIADDFLDDELLFAEEDTNTDDFKPTKRNKWKLLIVDDEKDVHSTTRLVLSDFTFEGAEIEFLSAYSAKEAEEYLIKNPDIAVILLDVVMETTHAGLELVHKIRNEMNNRAVRIILRTGQPGQAPERKVIVEYDINDYKHKAELTAQRLFTAVLSALRSYRDIVVIEQNRTGLKHIIDASRDLFKQQSIQKLAQGVLTQVISLMGLRNSMYMQSNGMAVSSSDDGEEMKIIASTGKYAVCHDSIADCTELTEDEIKMFNEVKEIESGVFVGDNYVGYLPTMQCGKHLLYVEGCGAFRSEQDEDLLSIFSNNVGVAFDNIYLNKEIIDTQKEIIRMLGEVVENRSKETAYHVVRVSEFSRILAVAMGLDENCVDEIYYASPMHDVGKIGIPDSILMKPGKLTTEEFEIMKTHAEIGRNILAGSKKSLLKTASVIAYQHHERWDGKGYPQGLAGEDIEMCGRIVCLSDIFDAICSKRVYKEAWSIDEACNYIKENSGKIFDPKLVEAFFDNFDDIRDIQEKYLD
jgi:response regulator RpfG family c-di-GMP phosphodiesterase